MKIPSLSAALALGLALLAGAEARAWFADIEDERPPPNGANGLSANGVAISGPASQGLGAEGVNAVILTDGSQVVLK